MNLLVIPEAMETAKYVFIAVDLVVIIAVVVFILIKKSKRKKYLNLHARESEDLNKFKSGICPVCGEKLQDFDEKYTVTVHPKSNLSYKGIENGYAVFLDISGGSRYEERTRAYKKCVKCRYAVNNLTAYYKKGQEDYSSAYTEYQGEIPEGTAYNVLFLDSKKNEGVSEDVRQRISAMTEFANAEELRQAKS